MQRRPPPRPRPEVGTRGPGDRRAGTCFTGARRRAQRIARATVKRGGLRRMRSLAGALPGCGGQLDSCCAHSRADLMKPRHKTAASRWMKSPGHRRPRSPTEGRLCAGGGTEGRRRDARDGSGRVHFVARSTPSRRAGRAEGGLTGPLPLLSPRVPPGLLLARHALFHPCILLTHFMPGCENRHPRENEAPRNVADPSRGLTRPTLSTPHRRGQEDAGGAA